jgi:endonuclease/exonuclease/phosphatase family metal-dependent hydrolase
MTNRAAVLFAAALALAAAPPASATEVLRVATFNIQELDTATAGYTALLQVTARMNADVVMIQEIATNAEATQFASFAASAGYPHHAVALAQSTLSGGLRNAVLSRYPIAQVTSLAADQLSPDPSANDISRDILRVVLNVPEVCHPVGLFTVHLKSGNTSTDDFRRAVELIRLRQAVEGFAAANPNSPIFVTGDLNEDIADGPFGNSFNSLPSGLPTSFDLGSDIAFPVVYDPFVKIAQFGGLSLFAANATQEDCSTCFATRQSSGRRLDYVFARFATPNLGDEVYASPVDDGVDAAPLGNYTYKAGAPLASGVSASASDHYPVYADYLLESCDGQRYGSAYPGDHQLAPRAGIRGIATPGNGAFALRLRYARPFASALLVLGQQKLNPPFGFPTAPYVPGAALYVAVTTAIGIFPAFTDSRGRADFPLPLPNSPSLLGLTFESQWFVTDAQGPNGVGSMSDAYSVTLHP